MAIHSFVISFVLLAGCNIALAQGQWVDVGSTHVGQVSQLASSTDGHLAAIFGYYSQFTPAWSTDEGQTWQEGKIALARAPYPQYLSRTLHFFSPAVGVLTVGDWLDHMERGLFFQGELAVTSDSGRTWHGLKNSHGLDYTGWPAQLQYGRDGNVILLTDDTHHASKDGLSWFVKSRGSIGLGPGYHASTIDLKRVIKLQTTNILLSDDSGVNYTQFPTRDWETDSSLWFTNLQQLPSGAIIAETKSSVYKSDDGYKWLRLTDLSASSILAYRFDILYLANRDTLLSSSDEGKTWTREVLPAPITFFVAVTPSLAYALIGNKIYKRTLPASVGYKTFDTREFLISPNPVVNDLQIHLGATSIDGEISIIDITGRDVLRTTAAEHIDVSALPSGVYQLMLSSGSEMRSQRFVIAR